MVTALIAPIQSIPTTSESAEPGFAALAQRAKEGDRDARGALFRRLRGPMLAVALTSVPRDDAEDIVQAAFLRMDDKIKDFECNSDASVAGWACTIVRHACADWSRRAERAQMVRVDEKAGGEHAGWLASLPDEKSIPPVLTLEDREQVASVMGAIRGLSAVSREVLLLSLGKGLRFREIASALSVSIGTVKSRHSRAREALHRNLGLATDAK